LGKQEKNNFLVRFLVFLDVLEVILLILTLFVFHFAQPEFETFFDRFYHLDLRTEWDAKYSYYVVFMAASAIFISFLGLLLCCVFQEKVKKEHKNVFFIIGILAFIIFVSLLSVL
jgi:amino acid transporter